jgi:hypothetical protein
MVENKERAKAARLSDYDFNAASRDSYGEDWPVSFADCNSLRLSAAVRRL